MKLTQQVSVAAPGAWPEAPPPAHSGARVPARALRGAIFLLASVIGAAAFASPFVAPAAAGATLAPAYLIALIALCLAAVIAEVQGRVMSAKLVALLGVLVAINSALRFAENAIPGPAGFTPVFMLILLSGYVFGGGFGFLMGALTMFVSAILTAGVGPWLPYQMFVAGWMGLSAGLLGRVSLHSRLDVRGARLELAALLLFGALWGLLYGAVMNLWSWPYIAGDPAQSWQAGLTAADGVKRYAAYYVATSLWWDAFAAVGNVALLALFGPATLRALRRFRERFIFEAN